MVTTTLAARIDFVIREENQNEPRIFFKQLVEASGLFPIEINVPDTIGAMMNGMSSMYETVSSYFGGGGSEGGTEGGEQSQNQVSSYGQLNLISRPINVKHRGKKAKKKTGAEADDEDDNMFDLLVLF